MNNKRRKELLRIYITMCNIKSMISNDGGNLFLIKGLIHIAYEELYNLNNAEKDYINNIPPNFQNGNRYEIAVNACDNLDCALYELRKLRKSNDTKYMKECISVAADCVNYASE